MEPARHIDSNATMANAFIVRGDAMGTMIVGIIQMNRMTAPVLGRSYIFYLFQQAKTISCET